MQHMIAQTSTGLSLLATWMTDEQTGCAVLRELEKIDWIGGGESSIVATYAEAHRVWKHLLVTK